VESVDTAMDGPKKFGRINRVAITVLENCIVLAFFWDKNGHNKEVTIITGWPQ
jgi:hypothetical protein